jgi:hypothetical protein
MSRHVGQSVDRRLLAGVEVSIAALVVIRDVTIPTLVVLVVLVVSLLARRQWPRSLGSARFEAPFAHDW